MDLASLLVGGAAARPDSVSGMQPDFVAGLQAMLASAPPDIRQQLQISSGFRSPQLQEKLWNDALAKYGSPAVARKWVAPPGRSQHGHGNAADLKYLKPAAQEWVHANAGNYGLAFPLSNEPWHIELASARGSGSTPAGGTAGLSYGAAQPNVQTGPAMSPALADTFMPAIPMVDPTAGLAALFTQGADQRAAQREEERRAEQARREALFGGSLFG